MNDLLLTDEEMYQASKKAVPGSIAYARAIADAQVRKVVLEIAKHIQDRSYRIGFATEVYLDGKFWDALRKDVGLE